MDKRTQAKAVAATLVVLLLGTWWLWRSGVLPHGPQDDGANTDKRSTIFAASAGRADAAYFEQDCLATLRSGKTADAGKPGATNAFPRPTSEQGALGNGAIGIMSGQPGGTYYKMVDDMVEIANLEGLRFFNRASEGGRENVERIASKENAAIGLSISDIQSDLKTSTNPKDVLLASKLRLLLPLYAEEVHVLARPEISRIEDLQGKRIAVGLPNSGTRFTTNVIFRAFGVRPAEELMLAPPDGLCQLMAGKLDAWFYVAGKPVDVLTRVGDLARKYPEQVSSLHALRVRHEDLSAEYEPATIGATDYPWLKDARVETIAPRALLVAYNFAPSSNAYNRQRCESINRLGTVLAKHLGEMQKYPQHFHPKWSEVDFSRAVHGWRLYECASRAVPTQQ